MIYRDIMKIMTEDNRADYYSPEEMDVEHVSWDCDNVSGEALGGDDDEDDVQVSKVTEVVYKDP